jgi:hypothetical protein
MKCERCLSTDGKNVEFRVRSDIIDLKVCPRCAGEARALGLAVEPCTERLGLRPAAQKNLTDSKFLSESLF